ncbi:cingulin-like [Saccostrea echinata]|uniref:cingulin-like n=1 Tax=Saccostrea echinata TaxID=191078 RepID=UPI002A81E330|nr:cingulin-like [Saccostrea echinata]
MEEMDVEVEEKEDKPGFFRRMSVRLSKRKNKKKSTGKFEEITKPAGYEHEDLHKIMKRLKQEVSALKDLHRDWEQTTKRPKLDHDFREHVEHVYTYASMIATRVGVATVRKEMTDSYENEIAKLKDDIRELRRSNYNDKRLQDKDFEIQRLKREVETLRSEIRLKRQSDSDQGPVPEYENRRYSRGRLPKKDENGTPDTSKYIIHDLKDKTEKLAKENEKLKQENSDLEKLLEDTINDNKELSKRNAGAMRGLHSTLNANRADEDETENEKNLGTEETSISSLSSVEEDKKTQIDYANKEKRLLQKIEKYEKENKELETRLQEKEHAEHQNQNTIHRLQQNLHEERKAKEKALDRLTETASQSMRSKNPNVTDLSDPNRPLKIAEKYSELYDNQWTNAIENLECIGVEEEKGIKILLDIITTIYKKCQSYEKEQLAQIEALLYNPLFSPGNTKECVNGELDSVSNEVLQLVYDCRKQLSDKTVKVLTEKIKEELTKDLLSSVQLTACSEYIQCCVQYCWLMVIQNPPIYMQWDFRSGISEFDKDVLKSYTKCGNTVAFMVWPVLYLHKDGPLLSKGVAQGTNRVISNESEV